MATEPKNSYNAKVNTKDKISNILETHGFIVSATIGHGSYATVKAAYSQSHKAKVAIKIVSKKKAPDDYISKFLPREIQVVKFLKHPNLVCFFQSIETTSRVYIAMELAENGDLLDFIKNNGSVAEAQTGVWFHQLVDGIEYCHQQGVVHRDLKCENLLLNKNNVLKITDFGFARNGMLSADANRPKMSETYCGSYAYAPPEILCGIPYNPMLSDIWSMGVVLFTMLFGRLPYDDTNHKILLHQVQRPPVFPSGKNVAEDAKDLLCRILSPAKRRIQMNEIREDHWFKRMTPKVLKKLSVQTKKDGSETVLQDMPNNETSKIKSEKQEKRESRTNKVVPESKAKKDPPDKKTEVTSVQ
ncbi:Testis-specific serine/threonine-protein kinase 4 [Holothuria leucospilota]|uniref:Testis-specific serine/threonine-protein kinase 4 n=1 Tax=Holothuria leucospilota TaxID=206669 RepID=A0A9Q1HDH2_HOLLE|nr:Testis-specific serine/threonine-protein kinase 4 [Holothuria leucospilota]